MKTFDILAGVPNGWAAKAYNCIWRVRIAVQNGEGCGRHSKNYKSCGLPAKYIALFSDIDLYAIPLCVGCKDSFNRERGDHMPILVEPVDKRLEAMK